MEKGARIESIIIEQLDKRSTLGYNELHKIINENYRPIARGTFNYYIQKLRDQQMIDTPHDDRGRGKKVYYSLTDSAKKEHGSGIPRYKSKSKIDTVDFKQSGEERHLLLDLLLIFFIHRKRQSRILKSEEELDELLKLLHASRKNLVIDTQEDIENRYMRHKEKRTRFKPISGLTIYKFEHEQRYSPDIPKISQEVERSCQYFYSPPGFSLSDILLSDNRALEHIDFTEEEVKEALNSLLKEDLLKKILQLGDESIYMTDDSLFKILRPCSHIYDKVCDKLLKKWKLRRPEEHEIKWLQVFVGPREAYRIRSKAYQDRRSMGKKDKQRIEKDIMDLDKEIQDLIHNVQHLLIAQDQRLKRYENPVLKLLSLIYPSYLQIQ